MSIFGIIFILETSTAFHPMTGNGYQAIVF